MRGVLLPVEHAAAVHLAHHVKSELVNKVDWFVIIDCVSSSMLFLLISMRIAQAVQAKGAMEAAGRIAEAMEE